MTNVPALTGHHLKIFLIRSIACLLLILFHAEPPVALAEQPADNDSKIEFNAYHTAPVVVDGRPLFNVFGVSTYPAKKRANNIARKIEELAKDPSFDPASIEVRETDGKVRIYASGKTLFNVYSDDAQLEGDFTSILIAQDLYLAQIKQAIENYREERQGRVLLRHALYAFVRTVVLAVLLITLFWAFRKIDAYIERRFRRKVEQLETKSQKILQAQQILAGVQILSQVIRIILVFFLIYLFVNQVLGLFPWTRYLSKTLLGYVLDPLQAIGQAAINYLPSLFFLIILVIIFRALLRMTHALFSEIDRGKIAIPKFHSEWAWPTYRIVRVFMVILCVVVAYPYIPGSSSEAFKGITILLGVLFSLGSSSFIANMIAGYTMTYRRAFKVGDWVKIGQHVGEVIEVRLLVTRLRSRKNEEIIIPNSTILNGEVTNYSNMAEEQGLILHTTVGIGYEVPWRQVEAMLLMAASNTEGLQEDARHFVLQKELGDFGVTYELNVFCNSADQIPRIYSALHCNIQDVFNEYGVAIMTPHYVGDTKEPKVVPKDQWYAPPAQQPDREADH